MPFVHPASLHVLIVDDHMTFRQALTQTLRGMGFVHIATAANCEEAAAKIRNQPCDIVFIDWVLPDKTGFDFVKEYRANKKFDDTAFVMVTVESDEAKVIDALRNGATSYIVKPVTTEIFKKKVQQVLEWVGWRKEQKKA